MPFPTTFCTISPPYPEREPLHALLNHLETERRQLEGEARRLLQENERLLCENERLREEVTVAHFSRKLGFFAYRAVRPTKTKRREQGGPGKIEEGQQSRRFYRRLPPSFTFAEFVQAAAGVAPRRAKKILLTLISEGTLHLKGVQIRKQKITTPVLRLRRAG